MNQLKTIYHFVIFSNLLIAMAAIAQCLLTYVVLEQDYNWYVVGIEGAATLLLYNFSLFLSKPKEPRKSPYTRTRWVFGHEVVFWVNNIVAVLLLIFCLLQVHFHTWVFLGFVGLVSVAYSLPILRVRGRSGGLRQVPGLKLFHIAVVWSLSSVGLPVIEMWTAEVAMDWEMANALGLLKILFLLICTLPFDIRDMEQDSYYHLKTIPNLIGEKRAKLLCYFLIVIHILLLVFSPFDAPVKAGIILTDVLIAVALHFILFRKKAGYHQVYLLDLALLAQYFCVLIFV
ncbi:UbiA family prenyltransferase [Sphingobacterium luzhongxinii]|uniref:UbiA family prenyltransferase n=1 Tax=Sphingobacterium luzhongxinii TaxID=2654181 RepID=UPI0013DC42CF|nr:UbiA family prenyltransferase [Sphingobacterium sp. xlx-73]